MEQIRVSTNLHFLVTETNDTQLPFFWLGDTAWELIHRLTHAEIEHYLDNRQRYGYNVIQTVILAEQDGLNTPNPQGHVPLKDHDPTQPNEAYFRDVDFVIEQAARRGLYIGLLPTWGDKVFISKGHGPVIFNPENAHVYARYLAERYADQPHILWILGGDRLEINEGVDYKPIWRAMAAGLQDVLGEDVFITYHPRGSHGSSMSFHDDDWLTMNMWQSGHMERDAPFWDRITADFHRTPYKPVLDGEPCYEDHPVNPYTREWKPEYGWLEAYDARKAAYRHVFAGACGHTYGHHSVWQMTAPTRPPINHARLHWDEALDRPAAQQMQYLKNLMLSRPYFTRIPDQSMLLGAAVDRSQHMQATRDQQGRYAMIYVPNAGQLVHVDTGVLSGQQVCAWWYDTRSGTAQKIEVLPRDDSLRFTSPSGDSESDWVLVLDDASQGFAAPGTTA